MNQQNKSMHIPKCMRILAIIMSLIMVMTVIRWDYLEISASGEDGNIIASDYTGDEISITSDKSFDNVTIPDTKMFTIDGAAPANVYANSINIEAGGALQIFGNLECHNITYTTGSCIMLGRSDALDNTNLNGIEFYFADDNKITNPDEIAWKVFAYDGSKWKEYIPPFNPSGFSVIIDGLTDTVSVEIKYKKTAVDSDYTVVTETPNEWGCTEFDIGGLEVYGDNPKKLEIEVNITDTAPVSREMMDCGLGDGMSPVNPFIIPLGGANLSNGNKTFSYTYSDVENGAFPHDIHIFLGYPNGGDGAIRDEVVNYLYAYTDVYSPGTTIDNDLLKTALAKELWDRFFEISMFDNFGIPTEAANRTSGIAELITRINIGSITDVATNEGRGNIQRINVDVNWGIDNQSGESVISHFNIYAIPDNKEFLVCTDFNNTNGSQFYLRSLDTSSPDRTNFYDDRANPDDYIIAVSDYGNVKLGRNGAFTEEISGEGLCTLQIRDYGKDDAYANSLPKVNARIMKSSNTYVAVLAEGESPSIQLPNLGVNNTPTDEIWSTGSENAGMVARVYIGCNIVHLRELKNIGISNYNIISVELADSSQEAGVTITPSGVDSDDYEVTFASNFYDTVKLKVTYSGGIERYITIERIGLVISYFYLFDEGDGVRTHNIEFPGKSGTSQLDYEYYKSGTTYGDQIAIYATYYHPSNDTTKNGANEDVCLYVTYGNGVTEIIGSDSLPGGHHNAYVSETGTGLATTVYFLGFASGRDAMGLTIPNQIFNYTDENGINKSGSVTATVINGGYDSTSTYGGTQCGSGKGVYWDGNISWY